MTTLASPISTRPVAVVDRDPGKAVPLAELGREPLEQLDGHVLVGLVLEIAHGSVARVDADGAR